MMSIDSLTLEQKVAQLFMVGFPGTEPGDHTRRFLDAGVGGVIFFRDNFDPLPDASAVAQLLADLRAALPADAPPPFFGIDQEGGQVERLPHTLFPSTVTPRAIALSKSPEALARQTYELMASHLAKLGFNLNFFPTLDVNLEEKNPIIGVRAFGDDPDTVWKLGQIALETHRQHGILAVAKHFPGHGNGTVDSHEALPTLRFTETELLPFQKAVEAGVPAMLVAHGHYPDLQPSEEFTLPSSLSPTVVSGLLREKLGFNGVVITDDLCMGAVTENRSASEAALLALYAGSDVLLYRQSGELEWDIYQAVCAAFRDGTHGLSRERLDASVARILAAKEAMSTQAAPPEEIQATFAPDAVQAASDDIARQAVRVLHGLASQLPLKRHWPLLIVYPDRTKLGNYAFDLPTSAELPTLLQLAGCERLRSVAYQYRGEMPKLYLPEEIETLVFVAFNALLDPVQRDLYATLQVRYPDARVVLVSVGTPYDAQVLPNADLHLALCSYRPASMRALAETLIGPPLPTPEAPEYEDDGEYAYFSEEADDFEDDFPQEEV